MTSIVRFVNGSSGFVLILDCPQRETTGSYVVIIRDRLLVRFSTSLVIPAFNSNPRHSGYGEFNIPSPFVSKVGNALKAEPRSVKLSNLVGAGGLWYGFGKKIMDMYVTTLLAGFLTRPLDLIVSFERINQDQGTKMSEMLTKVRAAPSLLMFLSNRS